MLNQCFNEIPHLHSHEMPLALTILVPECDRFSVVSVQSCVCDRGMPDVSGYISCYALFVFRIALKGMIFWCMNLPCLSNPPSVTSTWRCELKPIYLCDSCHNSCRYDCCIQSRLSFGFHRIYTRM
jgi:hypothetical protein